MGPFSSSQHKANDFILCGLTIKRPHDQSAICYWTPSVSQIVPARFQKLKVTLCQHSQELKNPTVLVIFFFFFCLLNLISFAYDWHYHCWKTEVFHMPGASCWPIIANIVLESTVKCQLPTQCLSLKLMFPFGNATGSFTIVLHYSLLLLAAFLATPSLWCFFTLIGYSGAPVCFAGVFICLFVCLKRSVTTTVCHINLTGILWNRARRESITVKSVALKLVICFPWTAERNVWSPLLYFFHH